MQIPKYFRQVIGLPKIVVEEGRYNTDLLWAAALIVLQNLMVLLSTRASKLTINITTIAKVAAIVAIVITGIAILAGNTPTEYKGAFDNAFVNMEKKDPAKYANAMLSVFFGYEGT